jgi:hypothetical protein
VDRIHRVISPQPAADEEAIMMIVNLAVIGIIWANGSTCSGAIVTQDRQAAQRAQPFALKALGRRNAV